MRFRIRTTSPTYRDFTPPYPGSVLVSEGPGGNHPEWEIEVASIEELVEMSNTCGTGVIVFADDDQPLVDGEQPGVTIPRGLPMLEIYDVYRE